MPAKPGLQVTRWTYVGRHVAPTLKRKLRKLGIDKCFEFHKSDDLILSIKRILARKPPLTSAIRDVGFLIDDAEVKLNVVGLPPPPTSWDVLCLHADVHKYNYHNTNNTNAWCSAHVGNTQAFVVNSTSTSKVLDVLAPCKSMSEFMERINTLEVFVVAKSYYVATPTSNIPSPNINFNHAADIYDSLVRRLDYHTQGKCLPAISLVCPVSDKEAFVNALVQFVKLDYPREKLELVVVDDTGSEKSLRRLFPPGAHVKYVNATAKGARLPVGFKLNAGVQYASHDVIFHFFDTQTYILSNFIKLVKAFVVCKRDALLSSDSGIRVPLSGSFAVDTIDIANMMYTKDFWNVHPFIESDDTPTVADMFVKYRRRCVGLVSFLGFSFRTDSTPRGESLPFDLSLYEA